jgi:hypothetical protein
MVQRRADIRQKVQKVLEAINGSKVENLRLASGTMSRP